MVGVLPQMTVAVFELGGIELFENILVQIALMIVVEQVKHVGGEHQPLVKLNGAAFKRWFHAIIPTFFAMLILPQHIECYG